VVTLAQISKDKAVEEERKNIQEVIHERVAIEETVVEEQERIQRELRGEINTSSPPKKNPLESVPISFELTDLVVFMRDMICTAKSSRNLDIFHSYVKVITTFFLN